MNDLSILIASYFCVLLLTYLLTYLQSYLQSYERFEHPHCELLLCLTTYWGYLPRFSSEAIQKLMPWRLLEAQGQLRTWHIGSVMLSHAMLCYLMLCYAMSGQSRTWHIGYLMLSYAMLCYAMSGQSRTWYIGSSCCFESVEDVTQYNNLLLRLARETANQKLAL